MRVNWVGRAAAVTPFLIGLVAVAGLVHIGTILAYPRRNADDAFARIAALAPVGAKTALAFTDRTRLPSGDAAMAAAVCRFDLTTGPLRLAISPFSDDFLSVGFHSRGGLAFYGLNIAAGGHDSLSIVVMTAAQKAEADAQDVDEAAVRDLTVVSPEARGFAILEAPAGGPSGGQDPLGHVDCGSAVPVAVPGPAR